MLEYFLGMLYELVILLFFVYHYIMFVVQIFPVLRYYFTSKTHIHSLLYTSNVYTPFFTHQNTYCFAHQTPIVLHIKRVQTNCFAH